jgi:hypothetical protein
LGLQLRALFLLRAFLLLPRALFLLRPGDDMGDEAGATMSKTMRA